jgi:molybdenum ABC transporter molybdate-binding protein
MWNGSRTSQPVSSDTPLVLFCAAGLKPPVEETAQEYEHQFGVPIQIQYGGSGTLLSNLRVTGTGDLYLAAEESYITQARDLGLVEETLPLVTQVPVLAVAKGNPKKIQGIKDLLRGDVRFALANPEQAAIGKVTKRLLERAGEWQAISNSAKVLKPTVNDLANDVKIGAIDAAVVWDSIVNQYPELEAVQAEEFASSRERVVLGVLKTTKDPAVALRFARYLGAKDKGLARFANHGYTPLEGDAWEEQPEILLFSGAVNRPAIEETVSRFETREGVRVTRVYNGCGILVSQMKSGQVPDAYFACDNSFLRQVGDLFEDPIGVSMTEMVILVAKGNPKGIHSIRDLTAPELKVGLANPEQSALGALVKNLLDHEGVLDGVMANVKTQTPTGDLLVNQMRTGSLDAVVVYRANTVNVRDALDVVPIDSPESVARQPFAIGRNSPHKYLVARLLSALRSEESKQRFTAAGFGWQDGEN